MQIIFYTLLGASLSRQIYQVTSRPSLNQAVTFQPVLSCSSFATVH